MPYSNPAADQKIEFWNKMYRISLLLLVIVAICIQISANVRSSHATEEARKLNVERQLTLQEYFKCLAVLRFEVPAAQLETKDGVIKALDSCAAKQ